MGSLDAKRLIDQQHDRALKINGTCPHGPLSSSKNSRLENWESHIMSASEKSLVAEHEPPPHVKERELENIKRICRELAIDIVYYVSDYKKLSASSKHAETLRRTVDELLDRHSILFKGMVKKLNISSNSSHNHNGRVSFTNVADQMFADERINWGRLVSIYAFGGRLARHCAEKHMYDYIDTIAEFLGNYVADKLAVWVHEQGGWDKFDEFFIPEATLESRLWRGLLVTAVGLGALATMVVVK